MDSIKKAVHVSIYWIVTMAKGSRPPKRHMPVSMKFNSCIHCLRHAINNYKSAQGVPFDIGCQMDAQLGDENDLFSYTTHPRVLLLGSIFFVYVPDTKVSLDQWSTASVDGSTSIARYEEPPPSAKCFHPGRYKFFMHCLRRVNANYGSAEAALYDTGYYLNDGASVLCQFCYGGKGTCDPIVPGMPGNVHDLADIIKWSTLVLNKENWDDDASYRSGKKHTSRRLLFGNAEGTHALEHLKRKCGNRARRSETMFSIFLNLSFYSI
ncbi:uncharacterized protein BO88DRAFT_451400 [Aspergillus vadensis CBS 113365]|uniref:Uncharacterized protein n=1 Tax=Aspergillus vadensis (strain CBS 113365 / IMI 142717 / IBT 24658) TaxID=1448311 RepID=A0A319C8P9_ASPVC|nr:hypothetical protein BO88DRAFT_451400 [Aspergillus vadensis CBS 113365]PYH71718.1 hypothetical protein BO88DRAFT_451400 [Aspergillus vadensis CBS 113365]